MTTIKIESLSTGTLIEVPGFCAAEVYQCEFDGYGYSVTYCTNDRLGWDALDTLYIQAAGSVEFAGRDEPTLRAETDISDDELRAKIDALDADISDAEVATLRNLGSIADLNGHVCQPVDEARRAQFFDAVAKALEVPALEAAE